MRSGCVDSAMVWVNPHLPHRCNPHKIHTSFSPVVVTERSERVSISEGAILEEVVLPVDLVEFGGDVAAARPGHQQLTPAPVHLAVDLPQPQVFVAGVVHEQSSLQCSVVPACPGKGKSCSQLQKPVHLLCFLSHYFCGYETCACDWKLKYVIATTLRRSPESDDGI